MRSVPTALLLTCAMMSGCATVALNTSAPVTVALADSGDTALASALRPALEQHPGESLCVLLAAGIDAFQARAAATDSAEHTLDVQYYIVRDDLTTRILLDRVVKAADRGVRVRLLVDDIHTTEIDAELAILDAHSNIEVRVFNPFASLRRSNLGRWLQFLTDGKRLNRRMHNKVWVADNQVAIVGGRNLADEYFAANDEINFLDLDLMAAGPVVKPLSASFDLYWNSERAVPIRDLVKRGRAEVEVDVRRRTYAGAAENAKASRYLAAASAGVAEFLERRGNQVAWARAYAVYDLPEKISVPSRHGASTIGQQILPLFELANSDVSIMSSYFVPAAAGMEVLERLHDRGVTVRVLTNSLAATDVAAAHAGYARYRVGLLEQDVLLYEIRPFLGRPSLNDESRPRTGRSSASLHAKAFTIDGSTVFVGSLNFDPRSFDLNTEVGIVAESPQLAAQLNALFERATRPRNSFQVTVAGRLSSNAKDPDKLIWITEEDGIRVRYDHEPLTSFWRRLSARVLRWLVPERLL